MKIQSINPSSVEVAKIAEVAQISQMLQMALPAWYASGVNFASRFCFG
ncbi:hypothetical protein [Helicobacter sp. MIT 01-3238]|nr:hypothetical protein [Helicobacter sp. MIT 01-3238]